MRPGKAMVEDLKEQGLLVKVVPHTHNVGTHDRCHTTVEPMIKPQWFVRMEEMARRRSEALKERRAEVCAGELRKDLHHWLEGTSATGAFPVSCGGDTGFRLITATTAERLSVRQGGAGEMSEVRLHASLRRMRIRWIPGSPPPCGRFLRWAGRSKTPELEYFYPTDVLVTGYDIIFFWVIRMVFSGIEQTGKCPFHTF
jgi:valyl-tRNA synthetase